MLLLIETKSYPLSADNETISPLIVRQWHGVYMLLLWVKKTNLAYCKLLLESFLWLF